MEKYDIFVSYRRDGGDATAVLISDRLRQKGYKVFFDLESMRSGDFNEQIYDTIDTCSDVIVVLPPNGLDRCVDENDWVRREISYAIKKNKNIIPILMRNFEFPEVLPDCIEKLRRLEGVGASMEYFDAVISRIEKLLLCAHKEVVARAQPDFKNKIKLPCFLRTPTWKEKGYERFGLFDIITDRFWWNLFNSGELPEDEKELSDYLYNTLIEKHYVINSEYSTPYFLRFYRQKEGEEPVLYYKRYTEWKESFDKVSDIYVVPKRYRDDTVNIQELLCEVADLFQTCFYNEKVQENAVFAGEMVLQGKRLIGDYSRKEGFAFEPVIDFCTKCFADTSALEWNFCEDFKDYGPKTAFNKVSMMLEDAVKIYGYYEDAAFVLNTKVKLFLKYFQLISFYLVPGYNPAKIKKYLMINYKYLKKNNVLLTKENEELFEKLINIYSNFK